MTENEAKAIKWLKSVRDNAVVTLDHIKNNEPNVSPMLYEGRKEKAETIIKGFEELEQYRAIGTVEGIQNMKKEEEILKFYYCESQDEYYIGKRIDAMYYAKHLNTGFSWCMPRYLPWGERVIAPNTLWKEHTYPSEPKEIPFFEWLQGFIKKECLGTVEECREAIEKQKAKKPAKDEDNHVCCPNCGWIVYKDEYGGRYLPCCENCGQAIDWGDSK